FSIVILAIVMAIGTIGMMFLEGWDPVTSFYFMALLATAAEGPALSPVTVAGKLFASLMAFVSVGAAISAITFAFGSLLGYALREGFAYVEQEEDKLKARIVHKDQAHSSTDRED